MCVCFIYELFVCFLNLIFLSPDIIRSGWTGAKHQPTNLIFPLSVSSLPMNVVSSVWTLGTPLPSPQPYIICIVVLFLITWLVFCSYCLSIIISISIKIVMNIMKQCCMLISRTMLRFRGWRLFRSQGTIFLTVVEIWWPTTVLMWLNRWEWWIKLVADCWW